MCVSLRLRKIESDGPIVPVKTELKVADMRPQLQKNVYGCNMLNIARYIQSTEDFTENIVIFATLESVHKTTGSLEIS